ncbi:hypothetical protein BKA81DRAFT_86158 [Phyllosticta paracitricarpa]|uniref:Uncharacterized protein n=2 Tax=Phyllosticta TaxID=121621 RepID=A0ABR1M3Q0_9PEZI
MLLPGPDNTLYSHAPLPRQLFVPTLSRLPRLLDPILAQGIGICQVEDHRNLSPFRGARPLLFPSPPALHNVLQRSFSSLHPLVLAAANFCSVHHLLVGLLLSGESALRLGGRLCFTAS